MHEFYFLSWIPLTLFSVPFPRNKQLNSTVKAPIKTTIKALTQGNTVIHNAIYIIHAVGISSALKKKEILQYGTTWMNLKGITLSESSHRRTNTAWFHLYETFKTEKQRVEWSLPAAGRRGELGSCYWTGLKFQLHRWVSSRDLMYYIVPLVNNTVLYT